MEWGERMQVFWKLGWFFKQHKGSYLIGLSTLFLIALIETINDLSFGISIGSNFNLCIKVYMEIINIWN